MKFNRNFSGALFGVLLSCAAVTGCSQPATPSAPAQADAAPAAATVQQPAHVLLYVQPESTAPADLAQKVGGWKSSGIVSDAVLMRSFGHEEKPGYSQAFSEMAILDFSTEAAYESWRADVAGELGPEIIISRADVLTHKRSRHNDPSRSIFVTGVYESLVSKDQYQEYTDDYIEPNMGNQYFSGIMTRYTMYLEREGTGGLQNPKAFLVTEYADQAAYDRKTAVKNDYKALLLGGNYPTWAHINDTKKALRRDFSEVYANPVPLQ